MGLFRDLQSEIEKRSLSGGGWPAGNGGRAGIETTCYALMALRCHQGHTRQKAIDLLLSTQNPDITVSLAEIYRYQLGNTNTSLHDGDGFAFGHPPQELGKSSFRIRRAYALHRT